MDLNRHNPGGLSEKDKGTSAWDDVTVLIRECIARNRQAQKMLYEKYSPTAYSIIRRYTRHDELAQEMLNDAFFKILTKLEMYNFTGSFEGWIRRVVVNTVTDHLRKYNRDNQMLHAKEMPEEVYVETDTVSRMSYKELLEVVHSLPDMHRAVFNLFVFESLKHKEIAEELDITEGNSRWYLNDARRRLKEKLSAKMKLS